MPRSSALRVLRREISLRQICETVLPEAESAGRAWPLGVALVSNGGRETQMAAAAAQSVTGTLGIGITQASVP